MTAYFPQACAVLRIVFEDFGDDVNPLLKTTYEVPVVPRRTRVDINSYREADTFEIEIDYNSLPIEPRAMRSCQVTICMQDMRALYEGSTPLQIKPSVDNVIFEGFADEDQMTFNDQARTVKLKGRDFTGLFIDQKWPGKLVSLQKPVDQVIREIVASLKSAGGDKGVTVENRTNAALPVLAKFYPDFGQTSGKRSAKKNETYWDVIQDIVAKAGLIAYIEIDKLVVTKPQTLYSPDKAVTFIYGKNVRDMEITRKMGKQKGFNVSVRCLIGKEVVRVDIPKDAKTLSIRGQDVKLPKQNIAGKLVEGEEAVAPFISFAVSNVNDKAHLIEIGEKIFEEISRQQLEGRFSTFDMESSVVGGGCFDLLKLRNGTPIQLEVEPEDIKGIQRIASREERAEYLVARGWDEKTAIVLSEVMGKYQPTFYTRSVSFTFGSNGLKIEVDFINFIETGGKGLGI